MPARRQRLTIILIPGTGGRTISFQLAAAWLVTAGLVAVSALVAATILTYQTRNLTIDRAELEELRRVARQQQTDLAAMAQTATEASKMLKDLARLEREIDNLTGSEQSSRTGAERGPQPALSDRLQLLFPAGELNDPSGARSDPSSPQGVTHAGAALTGLFPSRAIRTELERNVREMERLRTRLTHGKETLAAELDYRAHRPGGTPVSDAEFTDRFGWRWSPFGGEEQFHTGLDLAQEHGTPVVATGAGTVTFAGWKSGGWGNVVIVDHGYGYQTLYAHLSDWEVEEGDGVARGTRLGTVGSTGNSTGPHLHYEVHYNGEQVDPAAYLDWDWED